MCKMLNIKVGIKKLDFTEKRGKMAVYLTDGREVIVPVSMFKDISAMPLKERNKWYILDDQYFTFENMVGSGQMNSIKTIMGLIEGCVSSEKKETVR